MNHEPPSLEMKSVKGIEKLARLIDEKKSVLLLTHVNPDGDALGSMLGLAIGLKNLGKDVCPYVGSEISELYNFLPGLKEARTRLLEGRDFDMAVLLDCHELERTGVNRQLAGSVRPRAVLDHHVTSGRIDADLPLVDLEVSSTGELVFFLLKELNAEITPDIATNLYTAISTDTGSFNYSNTSARCLEVGAQLVAAGADPWHIHGELSLNRSSRSMKLLGLAVSGISYHYQGRVGVITVDSDMMAKTGTSEHDTEGLVEYPRAVRGVVLAMLVRENRPGLCHVSLRSDGSVNAAALAETFGGGGHRAAAGFSKYGSVEEVSQMVVSAADAYLNKASGRERG